MAELTGACRDTPKTARWGINEDLPLRRLRGVFGGKEYPGVTHVLDLDEKMFLLANQLLSSKLWSYVAFYLQGDNLGALLMMTALWWFWFKPDQDNRRIIIATLLSVAISISFARLAANILPFRPRPIYTPGITYLEPRFPQPLLGVNDLRMQKWSSFPSDHAALYFALAFGLWNLSRLIGTAAFAYASIGGVLARVSIGIHFPFDAVVGGLIGAISLTISNRVLQPYHIKPLLDMQRTKPWLFYCVMFLLTAEVSVLFEDVFRIARDLAVILRSSPVPEPI